jgi:hypothetical protein
MFPRRSRKHASPYSGEAWRRPPGAISSHSHGLIFPRPQRPHGRGERTRRGQQHKLSERFTDKAIPRIRSTATRTDVQPLSRFCVCSSCESMTRRPRPNGRYIGVRRWRRPFFGFPARGRRLRRNRPPWRTVNTVLSDGLLVKTASFRPSLPDFSLMGGPPWRTACNNL